jgi:hypothetical protein
VHQQLTAK